MNGEAQQYVFAYPFNGETIYLSYSINPIWESGNVFGFSVFSRDITRQKLDELAIRKSEANLTAIIENNDASVYSLDRELRFIAFNKITSAKMHQYFGVHIKSGDKILAPLAGAPNVIISEWESLYQKALNGEIVQFVKELPHNGRTAFVNYSFYPIWENNKVTGLSAVVRDISQQKSDELAIRKSEASLRAIINNTDMACILLDSKGFVVSFNNLAQQFSQDQNKRGMSVGHHIFECVEEHRQSFVTDILNQVKNGPAVNYQISRKIDGVTRWFDLTWAGIKDSDEAEFGCILTKREITQQKNDEIAIKKSEASLRTILNNTDMACILLDSAGNIVSYNNLAKHFSLQQNNYSLKSGDYIIDCIPEDRRSFVINVMKEVKNGSSINYQLNREINGISKWYDMTWAIIKDEDNADFGYIFTNREITEQKKLEIEREKITSELIQRNKALEEFTYVISHNLRAPVANIIGLSALFDGVAPRSNEYFKIVKSISKSADKLDDVISDLNQVMQVSVQVNERIEAVFLSQLIIDIKINIRQLIEKEKVKINCSFGSCEQILSVKSSLYSIFNNLILNSIKFSNAESSPVISISSAVNQGEIIISYKDNGRGIDTLKYGNEIFGLYKRFDTSVEGKGMGLFMVKMQVEGLGGSIAVQSKLNEGTEFVMEFPQVHLQEA